jgi:predicted small lipoprotein YifL
MLIKIGKLMHRHSEQDLDRRRASFDKLRMRTFLRATKTIPHPELVEGRRAILQWIMIVAVALSLSACGKSGPPEPPNPQTDKFPRQYPDPSSL